ncbi:hypothetical protein, partial [Stenotrophomonas humi]|uniref:hypothetical protein n=1 Tax=Stenotrophomonas humi TaxID=405444 RepID=UPI001B80B64D
LCPYTWCFLDRYFFESLSAQWFPASFFYKVDPRRRQIWGNAPAPRLESAQDEAWGIPWNENAKNLRSAKLT